MYRLVLLTLLVLSTYVSAATKNGAGSELLAPDNHVLVLIDHQPQMFFGVQSHDRQTVINNTVALAKSAKVFKVPTVLTTVAEKSFSGPLLSELKALFPGQKVFDRTTMNTWEDKAVRDEIRRFKKKKIVMAALWSEVCLAYPAVSAIEDGHEVYFISDASGGTTKEAHDMAVARMIQAGAKPMTWLQYLLELQRDWARGATYNAVAEIAVQHAGAYGQGMLYAKEMFGAKEGQKSK